MKKFFSMMLMVASMVSVLTGCKKDDEGGVESGNASQILAGVYTGKMLYYFGNEQLGSKDVTFTVSAEGSNKVSISIPEINSLVYSKVTTEGTIEVKVNKFPGFVVKGINAVALNSLTATASKCTTVEELAAITGEYTLKEELDKIGFPFRNIEINNYDMEIMGNQRPGSTTISGEVVFVKNVATYGLEYRFSPAPGIIIYGLATR